MRKAVLLGCLTTLLVLAMLISACLGSEEPGPLQKVVFMAGFKPQANLPFVVAYVAQEKGFFRDQNLEVDIRHASRGEHLKR